MLAATGDRGAQPALVGALDDPSERVRAAAATGLGSLGDPAMVEPLAARLAKDKKPFVRKAAAYAIGHFSSHDGTSALVATLKDKDAEVRGAAAVALGRYADAQAVAGLTAALTDKYDFVRARAAHALGVNGRAAAQAVPQLVTLLTSDKDNEVRRQAATSLGLIGERSALPALNQAQHDPDPYLSLAALDAIRRIETGARN